MRFRLPSSSPGRPRAGRGRSKQQDDPGSAPTIATPRTPAPADAGSPAPPVVVPKWVQLVLLPLAVLGLWALARASGPVLLILTAASTGALILNPLVKKLERGRVPRGVAILLVYVGLFAGFAGVGVLLSDPISTQVNHFAHNV